jgi:hypothetical protein
MPTFSTLRSEALLRDALQGPEQPRRLGGFVKTSLHSVADVALRLESIVHSALDKVQAAAEKQFSEIREDTQRAAARLSYAGSLRMPVKDQLALCEAHRDSETVTLAAARQRHVPAAVQHFLIQNCPKHTRTMLALTRNDSLDWHAAAPLVLHESTDVRQAFAEKLGPAMRITDPKVAEIKQLLYNALLSHYESGYAQALVPVCRDPQALDAMFAKTKMSAANARLFVENPFSSDSVLLSISSMKAADRLTGGDAVADDAKSQLSKRLAAADVVDCSPQP